jgi:hypothetical protein
MTRINHWQLELTRVSSESIRWPGQCMAPGRVTVTQAQSGTRKSRRARPGPPPHWQAHRRAQWPGTGNLKPEPERPDSEPCRRPPPARHFLHICRSCRRCSAPFYPRFGDAGGELKGFKTMSLPNLRQLLMGTFCSKFCLTTDSVDTVKKAYNATKPEYVILKLLLHYILTYLGGWGVNILSMHMHIDRVNLRTE